jgi:hypothetical protein
MKFMNVKAMAMLAEYEQAIAMGDNTDDQTAHDIESVPNCIASSGQRETADPTICPSCGGALFGRAMNPPHVVGLYTG